METIQGKTKTVREILKDVKYSIDYYQREYKWEKKQVEELINDLVRKFEDGYDPTHPPQEVKKYPHYFLGTIIISQKEGVNYIVDGQQRLTSLTLLLIRLRNLQRERLRNGQMKEFDVVNVDDLIMSVKYREKSFNLNVSERAPCMKALFEDDNSFDATDSSESVRNLQGRYEDMEGALELKGKALPHFVDWLQEKVILVEITASSDDDAYTIFETMNDRGLSLSPTDMLKSYLLSNIYENERNKVNDRWRKRSLELKGIEADCIKTWLRSQYASKIRERRSGAAPEDFEEIGTGFHRWLRTSKDEMGLTSEDKFLKFINHDFDFYTRRYLDIIKASKEITPGFERIYYNAQLGFTLQNMILLAPLCPEDKKEIINLKLRLTAHFIDILLAWRLWNSRSITYQTMHYGMFQFMLEIRRLEPRQLAEQLGGYLSKEKQNFDNNDRLRVHQQNRRHIRRFLARLTDFVETSSGLPSHYVEYVSEGKKRYEIEHIWANDPKSHIGESGEFENEYDFAEHRDQIGGLLLLPKSFNASYGKKPYKEKLKQYLTHNLLARSLHQQCYEHNPGFLQFMRKTGLPFKSYPSFKKTDIDERGRLYRQIAKLIWSPENLSKEMSL